MLSLSAKNGVSGISTGSVESNFNLYLESYCIVSGVNSANLTIGAPSKSSDLYFGNTDFCWTCGVTAADAFVTAAEAVATAGFELESVLIISSFNF